MDLRTRFFGVLLVACGLALCYGAVEMWPMGRAGVEAAATSSVGADLLRIVGACVVAVFGVGNVLTGLVVVLRRTARE